MRIFFSAGEPSGDVHGGNLIRALAQRSPKLECVGFGGERMAQAGCNHLFPLAENAVMGITGVIANLPKFLRLFAQADRSFREERPDAVVLIDCPGFNWWIAKKARAQGIPVFYFVPPQLWAWAGWRVRKMRRFVDHTLCSLPFEESWFRTRGVAADYIGHPFFDEVQQQKLDPNFLNQQHQRGGTIVGILPGSRTQELHMNLQSQLRAAELIHRARPDTRFLVACYKDSHQAMVESMRRKFPSLPCESFVKRTPEIIELSKTCISVSGSVSLELLYRAKPTVILYRMAKSMALFYPIVRVKYITLVNLLADKMLFPEFLSLGCKSAGIADTVLQWLNDERAYANSCRELLALREQVALPGACERAARRIVEVVGTAKALAA